MLSPIKMPKYVLYLALFILGGCGFHLRGMHPQSEEEKAFNLIVIADEGLIEPEFLEAINREFGHLRDNAAGERTLYLQLVSFRYDKRFLTVDDLGRVNEFELIHTLSYQLYEENAEEVRDYIIRTQRLMGFDREQLLIKEREEAFLLKEMRQDLLRQLKNHLRHVS